MSDDLDALERLYAEAMPPGFNDQLYAAMVPDLVDAFPALIQRLREAEARANGNFTSYERVKSKYSAAKARIAQLERVREAAVAHYEDGCDSDLGTIELKAALDAVEEKR